METHPYTETDICAPQATETVDVGTKAARLVGHKGAFPYNL